MKKLAILLPSLMIIALIIGAAACSSGGPQPTATSTPTPVGDIGETKQGGGLKVTLNEAYVYDLCLVAGNYCDIPVNLSMENTGESKLQNFTCSLIDAQGTQDSIEVLSYSGLIPTEKRENVYLVFGDHDAPLKFVKDSELRLIISAEDPAENSYTVEFVLPPINQMTVLAH